MAKQLVAAEIKALIEPVAKVKIEKMVMAEKAYYIIKLALVAEAEAVLKAIEKVIPAYEAAYVHEAEVHLFLPYHPY